MGGTRDLIIGDITKVNFSDKYRCDSILGKYKYGRDNSVILKNTIKGYEKMSEEEQNKSIIECFSYIRRAMDCKEEELPTLIKTAKIPLSEYEYLEKTPGYKDMTIELLVKYDVINMINKADWTMEDVTKIFATQKDKIMERIRLYTGENKTNCDRSKEIFKKLYNPDNDDCVVNFINEFLSSEKQDYDCRTFFNDKPIYIYKSEIETIKKLSKKYRTNDKDGRRIVRLVCLLLAWQKAFQNQYYNHRLNGYAILRIDNLLSYNPIVENDNGRSDSKAMINDRKKLVDDGYIQLLLPQVSSPRIVDPDLYYKVCFCVEKNNSDNEEVVLTITDFEHIWEQIFVAAFKEFDVLEEPKEKDIKEGQITEYDSKLKNGKVYVADKEKQYYFSGSGKYKVGDTVKIYIMDSKKGKIKILKNNDRVYATYKAVKRCSTCGKMFYAKQMGNGTGNCDVCNRR